MENKPANQQCLHLVSVGPGDPSMLTLGAVNIIQKSTLIAYPVSHRGGKSLAAKIASEWITDDQKKLPIYMPMVSDALLLQKAWKEAAEKLASAVAEGEVVSFLSQGDISLFSTGSYILLELRARYPECLVKVIPGVTSIAAAAAFGKYPLAMQRDQVLISPTPNSEIGLEKLVDEIIINKRNLILLKLGDRWLWVKPLLEKKGLLESSLFAESVGFQDQLIQPAVEVPLTSKSYFSLLFIRQTLPSLSALKGFI